MKKIPISLEKHQKILYELLYILDDFCKDNNIRYFLTYGTLLGAVRHQGIIPWDDDVDVMMERKEYERFQKLIIANPPDGYQAYSIKNTKGYLYPFIKFGKKDTLLIEPFPYVPKEGIGINIDVFPIDGCPDEYVVAQKYTENCMKTILRNLNNTSYKNFWSAKGKKAKLIALFNKFDFLKKIRFQCLYNSLASKYDLNHSKFFSVSQWTWYGARDVHPIEDIKNSILLRFGERDLPVPIGYHDFLTKCYGDYMTPPPIDKRKSTHIHGDVYILL